jgi:hypothetical protein
MTVIHVREYKYGSGKLVFSVIWSFCDIIREMSSNSTMDGEIKGAWCSGAER